ncbi:hypothetical protein CMI47_13860 [Candidatus Pacearchaeota archaeon]|jgi:SAM-dependent methyltransferase|nr:hypothetical protein [Candidatus Pacearchaeota archaeon]|tara:strand:- start:1338 stop:2084 length:747 start_codon:yes stop_codon:yes gene_type:complete
MYSGKIVKYYDDIYNKKDYVTESEFIETKSNINKLLDVGCGTGTHLESLYKSGRIFYGIDLSEEMIELANDKFKDNDDVSCIHSDIVNFKEDNDFDTIISMFNVVNHILDLEELDKYFKFISKLLLDGGTFIFDCFNGASVFKDNPKDFSKGITSRLPGGEYIMSCTSEFDPMISYLKINNNIKVYHLKDLVDEFDYTIDVTVWTPKLLRDLIEKYNMKVSKIVSNFDYHKDADLEDYKITFVCCKDV